MAPLNVNVGCGATPTVGWVNFDNSPSVLLGKVPVLVSGLARIGLLSPEQAQYARTNAAMDIRWARATKLPLRSRSVDTLYSSHMLEHLGETAASDFLREARRVLVPGGILRIAVPDLRRLANSYVESGDADGFLRSTHLALPSSAQTLLGRVRLALLGHREHHWMYDSGSLCRLLETHGFERPTELEAGRTQIQNPGALDLFERSSESIYVETFAPGRA